MLRRMGSQYPFHHGGRLIRYPAIIDGDSMDALSDVLKSVHLEGAVYVNAEFTAPWCVSAKFGLASVRARLTRADHVVFFHYLTEGSCKVRLEESLETMDVSAGDLVLFLNENRHLLGS